MKLEQIAINLFTLRDFCKDNHTFKRTLKKVKEIGYSAVQISSVGIEDPYKIRELVEKEGLKICATHESPKKLIEEPNEIVNRLKILACKHTAFPHPGPYPLNNREECLELAKKLNNSGKIMYNSGIILSYHNHDIEFVKYDNQSILDIIFDNTNELYLRGEFDTFWIQKGGDNPVKWCNKLKNRLPLLHMKDYVMTLDRNINFGEVGRGNLDWNEIVHNADNSGCEWYIVEQDFCNIDPFESIKISYDYIVKNLINK